MFFSQAEELNNIVGNAFKMAYAYQRQASLQPQQPTFNEVIQQQLEVQQQENQHYQVLTLSIELVIKYSVIN